MKTDSTGKVGKIYSPAELSREREKESTLWKRLSKQLEERLMKALQDNDRLLARLEKINNESIEVIHDLSGNNEVLKSAMQEALILMKDSRNIGIIEIKFEKLLKKQ